MLKRFKFVSALAAVLAAGALQSCDNDSTIGESIVSDQVKITVDSTFTLTGRSVANTALRSRTITQLIGNIDAPQYGRLSSDVVTQLMPATAIQTNGITRDDIDSLKLQMLYQTDGFTGDSIVPMGIKVYPLTKDLPNPIYSDFDPSGYYNVNDCLGQSVYSASWDNTTKDEAENKAHVIEIKLPVELGRKLFDAFKADSTMFSNPELFAKNVFKGLYINSSFGSGRIVRIEKTLMNMYFHRTSKISGTDRDTTINYVGSYFAVTPEIISNNNIRLDLAPNLRKMVDEGRTVIASPAGMDAEITFPAREIKQSYLSGIGKNLGVINSLSMTLHVDSIDNKYGFTPPPYLLMVLKKDRDKFFADNKINDNKTSFYASYNSRTRTYTFSGLRDYILDILEKENVTDEDVTFTLTPVNVVIETNSDYWSGSTSIVTSIIPYITRPVMCVLNYKDTDIRLTYSHQNLVTSSR